MTPFLLDLARLELAEETRHAAQALRIWLAPPCANAMNGRLEQPKECETFVRDGSIAVLLERRRVGVPVLCQACYAKQEQARGPHT